MNKNAGTKYRSANSEIVPRVHMALLKKSDSTSGI
ncbi:MAG: Arc family DNA-binding protein [Candidatus Hydrogenedentes bacterium]|nr:Arc family DNA-binding protein [Candidatus Hydrogenedentota bacterium]